MKKRLNVHKETIRNLQERSRRIVGMKTPGLQGIQGGSTAICTVLSRLTPLTNAPSGCMCTPFWSRQTLRAVEDMTESCRPTPPPPDPERPNASIDYHCYSRAAAACI